MGHPVYPYLLLLYLLKTKFLLKLILMIVFASSLCHLSFLFATSHLSFIQTLFYLFLMGTAAPSPFHLVHCYNQSTYWMSLCHMLQCVLNCYQGRVTVTIISKLSSCFLRCWGWSVFWLTTVIQTTVGICTLFIFWVKVSVSQVDNLETRWIILEC